MPLRTSLITALLLSSSGTVLVAQSAAVWDNLRLNGTFNDPTAWIGGHLPGANDFVTVNPLGTVTFTGPFTSGDTYTTFDFGHGTFSQEAPLSVVDLAVLGGGTFIQRAHLSLTQDFSIAGATFLHESGNLTIPNGVIVTNDGTTAGHAQLGGMSSFNHLTVLSDGNAPASAEIASGPLNGLINVFVGGGGDASLTISGGTSTVANFTPITIGWIDQNTATPASAVPGQSAALILSGNGELLLGDTATNRYTGINLAAHYDASLSLADQARLVSNNGITIGHNGHDAPVVAHLTQTGGTVELDGDLNVHNNAAGVAVIANQSGGNSTYRDILLSSSHPDVDSSYTLSGGTLTARTISLEGQADFTQTAGTLTTGSLLVGAFNATDNLATFSGGTFSASLTAGAGHGGHLVLAGTQFDTPILFAASGGIVDHTAGTLTTGSINLAGGTINHSGGAFTVTEDVEGSSGSFSLTDGAASLEGSVRLVGTAQLNTSGGADLVIAGTTTLEDNAVLSLGAGLAELRQTTTVTSGELRVGADADATFADVTIASAGSLLQTGGIATSDTLDISGTATLPSGRWDGTTLHVRDGASATWTLNQSTFSGDAYIAGTAALDGSGRLAAASLALNAAGAALTQSDGTLAITGETRLNAGTAFTKSGGSFTSGSFVFTGSDASFVHSGGTSTVNGPLTVTQLDDATFTISGGTFRTTGNASVFGNGTSSGANDLLLSGDAFFDVDGDLSLSGNAETVTSGTSRFDVGGTLSTGLVNGETTRLIVGSGSTLNSGDAVIGGNGKATVSLSGTHHADGSLTVGSLASTEQSLYLVNSAGSLTADAVTLAPVSGSSARLDVAGVADIAGDVHLGAASAGGSALLRVTTGTLDAATLTVHAGSTFTHSGNLRLTGTLTNNGSTTFSGGSVDATTFTNTNTLTVNGGLASNLVTADFVNTGAAFLNASLTLDRTSGAHANGGSILIESGATLGLYPSATFHNTGDLAVAGSFGGISATILDEGTLSAGIGIGTGTILGDYTLLADGHLSIELGGLIQGTQYDRLHFQGTTPEFYGWLDVTLVNGFNAALGDTFDILTGTSNLSTTFRGINVTGLDPSLMLVGENLGTTFRLTVAEYVASGGGGSGAGGGLSPVPEPSTYAALCGLTILLWTAYRRRARSSA